MQKKIEEFLYKITNKTVLAVILSMIIFSNDWKLSSAGSCWLRVEDSGRCLGLERMGVSKEDCCRGGSANSGWTPHDEYTDGRIFYFEYLAGGAPDCRPCHHRPRFVGSGNNAHETCENVNCPGDDRQCRIKEGRARCVCAPDCSQHDVRHRGLVCGSDGNSYRNYCTMLKMNCRRDRNTQVEYFGRCQYSCSKVRCRDGKNCVEDQNGVPHCISCHTNVRCPNPRREQQKICGADGFTYASSCHFRKATCLNGRSIGLAYMGQCDSSLTCSTLTCPWGKKCLLNPGTNRPQCVTCDGSCSALTATNPICGTDRNSYTSWCLMQREACRRGIVIETKHYGPCHRNGEYPEQGDDYVAYYEDK